MKPASAILHRIRMQGIAACGAKERDGAKFSTINRYVSCPACIALVASRRAAAKARGRKAGAA